MKKYRTKAISSICPLLPKEHIIKEFARKTAIENKVLHRLAKEDDAGKNNGQPEAKEKIFEHGRSVYEPPPTG
ncbi:hypothetical protein [Herbaspirillum sp.]|uniref:hypothetical protein n=1 Tax=Herbaspirillum sp. TaxID=1890675 RepID=UPI001B2687EE|nr:hypothetical protein [Herbaspirillum sp.]MBO9536078.1 hypothetical protein [Herbaspirillum sp.]